MKELTLSAGELAPAFDPEETEYAATVPYATESVTVNVSAQDPLATVAITGGPVQAASLPDGDGAAGSLPEESRTAVIPLAVGPNSILIEVTAENGNTALYTIEVTRSAAGSPGGENPGGENPGA